MSGPGSPGGMRKGHGHKKGASVSFDEPEKTSAKGAGGEKEGKSSMEDERRKERRRSEAKAAIEVGFNVSNISFG